MGCMVIMDIMEIDWNCMDIMELVDGDMELLFGYIVYIEIMEIYGNIVEYGYDGIEVLI